MKKKYIQNFTTFLLVSLLCFPLLGLRCSKQVNQTEQTQESHLPVFSDTIRESKSVVRQETGRVGREVFENCEEMPSFPKGEISLARFLGENVRCPDEVIQAGVHGRIVVSFVIQKDGSICLEGDKIEFHNRLKDKSENPVSHNSDLLKLCEKEALRILKLMPKWIPGKQNGEPVASKWSLPIVFNEPKPQFPGGEAELKAFLEKNFRYPKNVEKEGIHGDVVVSVVVKEDGMLDFENFETENRLLEYEHNHPYTNATVSKLCKEEALRVCKLMPKWMPGKINGKSVSSKANFSIQIDKPKPQFSGGNDALEAFIKKNLHCPKDMKQAGIHGKIVVSFIVRTDGTLSLKKLKNLYYIENDSTDSYGRQNPVFKLCEKEALRIFKMMPKWIPVKVNGKTFAEQGSFILWFNELDPNTPNIDKMIQVYFESKYD